MRIEGSYPFAAPQDVLWPMLLDPDVLARVMPGCEQLETVGENQFYGILKIKVGPVQGKFQGNVALSDISSPKSFCITVDGKGAPGYVKGTGQLRLEPDGDMTLLHYSGDAQVGGRLASVGQRLLDTSANAIIRQSLEGLGQQVQARMMADVSEEIGGEPRFAAPTAPSQTEFALGVAKNLAEEYLAPERRNDLLKNGLIVVGALLFIRLLGGWWMDKLADRIVKKLEERR